MRSLLFTALILAATALFSPTVFAETTSLERKVDVLAAEIERLQLGSVMPSVGNSVHGLGPAASKVYHAESGVTIGGYGEMVYQNKLGEDGDTIDFVRNILYVGYKFSDNFVLNTEIELEHVKEVFFEFGYVDWLWRPEINLRAGLMLIPMGLVNELHEPTTFLPALRPETERRIIPSTWRENGIGLFGTVGTVSYRAYLVNGMDASGWGGTGGLRGGRQKGAKAKADDFGGVLRADVDVIDGLRVGSSVYYGGADQEQYDFDVTQLVWEAHADFSWRGLSLRGLVAGAHVTGAEDLSVALVADDGDPVGEFMLGWYGELGYDVLSLVKGTGMSLSPYVRYEQLDTQATMPDGFSADPASDRRFLTAGLAFKPIDQVVLKGEWQQRTNSDDSESSTANVVLGYIF